MIVANLANNIPAILAAAIIYIRRHAANLAPALMDSGAVTVVASQKTKAATAGVLPAHIIAFIPTLVPPVSVRAGMTWIVMMEMTKPQIDVGTPSAISPTRIPHPAKTASNAMTTMIAHGRIASMVRAPIPGSTATFAQGMQNPAPRTSAAAEPALMSLSTAVRAAPGMGSATTAMRVQQNPAT
jgi:hypothetical protein